MPGTDLRGPLGAAPEETRREAFRDFVNSVFIPQRRKLLAYRAYTGQSAQVDSDGYLAQIIASLVTNVAGNSRRGKSGAYAGDLSDGTEVKSAYRAEQMNEKEDTHVNFGAITPGKLLQFLDRDRAIIVHTSYDTLGRVKIEVLWLPLRHAACKAAVEAFLGRSNAEKPQLQPRLYPDGRRDRLQSRPGHFLDLGARLLARAVVEGDHALVDKWNPRDGLRLEECLDLAPGPGRASTDFRIADPTRPDEFVESCMISHRRALVRFCEATASSQNVGFGNLAQHLVSIVTEKKGTFSAARGADLQDGSEIKLAMGVRGDVLGTEDFPRLNLGMNLSKILSWPVLYPVRILCAEEGLQIKVFQPDMEEFREQVRDYFAPSSRFKTSTNLQYHAPAVFESNFFTGSRGDGTERRLPCSVLYCAREQRDGTLRRC